MSSTAITGRLGTRSTSFLDVKTTPTFSGILREKERLTNGMSRAFSSSTRSW